MLLLQQLQAVSNITISPTLETSSQLHVAEHIDRTNGDMHMSQPKSPIEVNFATHSDNLTDFALNSQLTVSSPHREIIPLSSDAIHNSSSQLLSPHIILDREVTPLCSDSTSGISDVTNQTVSHSSDSSSHLICSKHSLRDCILCSIHTTSKASKLPASQLVNSTPIASPMKATLLSLSPIQVPSPELPFHAGQQGLESQLKGSR
jgi:hypothetical protein